jgi:anti-sigma factor RsiW
MKHEKYKQWIQLQHYGELCEEESILLTAHLNRCEECRAYLKELRKLHQALAAEAEPEPDEELLAAARLELRERLTEERGRQSFWSRLRGAASGNLLAGWTGLPYATGFASAAVLIVLGFLVGYATFAPSAGQPEQVDVASSSDPWARGEMEIANVRFLDADASDGNVEFYFDAVVPMHVRGSVNDARVQKVLSHALIRGQNAGVRLRAISALSGDHLKELDHEVKSSLIRAVKLDDNDGVRMEALTALKQFDYDEQIKEALLHVLNNDPNPGLRIAAINSFQKEQLKDPDVIGVLQDKSESDGNGYIRVRSRAVLQEVRQQ